MRERKRKADAHGPGRPRESLCAPRSEAKSERSRAALSISWEPRDVAGSREPRPRAETPLWINSRLFRQRRNSTVSPLYLNAPPLRRVRSLCSFSRLVFLSLSVSRSFVLLPFRRLLPLLCTLLVLFLSLALAASRSSIFLFRRSLFPSRSAFRRSSVVGPTDISSRRYRVVLAPLPLSWYGRAGLFSRE